MFEIASFGGFCFLFFAAIFKLLSFLIDCSFSFTLHSTLRSTTSTVLAILPFVAEPSSFSLFPPFLSLEFPLSFLFIYDFENFVFLTCHFDPIYRTEDRTRFSKFGAARRMEENEKLLQLKGILNDAVKQIRKQLSAVGTYLATAQDTQQYQATLLTSLLLQIKEVRKKLKYHYPITKLCF